MAYSGQRRAAVVTIAIALVVASATVALVVAVGDPDAPRSGGPGAAEASSESSVHVGPKAAQGLDVRSAVASLAVLRNWDRKRAAAWASGSMDALRRLYVPGSRSGAADVARLRAWRSRRLSVQELQMQVMAVDLRRRGERSLVIVVTDRVVGAVAEADSGRREALPQDRVSTRRLHFTRLRGAWRLREAYDVAQSVAEAGASASSPASSTASTSASENR